MKELPSSFESVPPAEDRTAAEACPFEAPADPATDHVRHQVAKEGAQRLFDVEEGINTEDPDDIVFDMEKQLKSKETIAWMAEKTPIKARLLIARTLRRALFTTRGHITDRYLLRYVSMKYRNNTAFTDDNWPSDPGFYESTTVPRYYGTADRFMRTIVGIGDLAARQADVTLSESFRDVFHSIYRRYYRSLEAHKQAYPAEDVPKVDPDPEVNWKLGRRGNGDNTIAVQLAHALAYFRQHPDASVDNMQYSALTSTTVLSTAARIRRQTFNKLGLKAITQDFDSWETKGHSGFEGHASLFVYGDDHMAKPLSQSLAEKNDNYCSANIDVQHTHPDDLERIDTIVNWVQEHSDWPGVDDDEGGLLHERGIFNQATLQLIIGGCVGGPTIYPALLQTMHKRYPEDAPKQTGKPVDEL